MNKSLLIRSILMGFIVGIALYAIVAPNTTHAEPNNTASDTKVTLVYNGHLTICKLDKSHYEVVKTIKGVVFTGYSDTKDQTDDREWETASGKHVADGFIATNDYPFGTIVMIPELFGDKKFVVEDRMNKKYTGKNRVDIFFPNKEEGRQKAIEFGARRATMLIVQS